MKLFNWVNTWLQTRAMYKVGTETYNNYVWAAAKIQQYGKNMELKEYTETDGQDLLIMLALCGFSKSSIAKVRLVQRQALDSARQNGYILTNCCKHLFIPVMAPEKDVRPLTIEQQEIVESACEADLNGDLILFMLNTGVRREELQLLEWTDYFPAQKYVHIKRSKTLAGIRDIPLLSRAEAIIKRQPRINEYIFNSRLTHHPVTDSVMKKTYLRLRKVTGVETLTNHVCRHTFATRMWETTKNAKAVAMMLGHTSVRFTLDKYVKPDLNYLKNELQRMEKKIG